MKKINLLTFTTLSITTLFLTSSCFSSKTEKFPQRVRIPNYDVEHNLRYFSDNLYSNEVYVDKYYYQGEQTSGNIVMDIVIPNKINNKKVVGLGRQPALKVKETILHVHDFGYNYLESPFTIVTDRVFDKGTTITINLKIESSDMLLERYNMKLKERMIFLYQNPYYDYYMKDISLLREYDCVVNVTRVSPFVETNKIGYEYSTINYDISTAKKAILMNDNINYSDITFHYF